MSSKCHAFFLNSILFCLIIVVLMQILLFVHYKIEHSEYFAFFTNLWCGIASLLLASITLFLLFGCNKINYYKSTIFTLSLICILQAAGWIVAETLEWRNLPKSGKLDDIEFVRTMYLASLCCNAIIWTLSFVGAIFIYVVKIRLSHELALIWDLQSHDSTWRCQSQGQPSRCFLLNRILAEEERVNSTNLNHQCKASRSWRFLLYRSSTPKKKDARDMKNRMNNRNAKIMNSTYLKKTSMKSGRKKNSFGGTFSMRKKLSHITDDDLNKSDPLRMIAIFNPAAVGIEPADQPPEEISHPNDPEADGKNSKRVAEQVAALDIDPKFVIEVDQTVLIRRLGERSYRAVSLQKCSHRQRPSILDKNDKGNDNTFVKSTSSASFHDFKL